MSDDTQELNIQLRDEKSKLRVAEAALADVKRQRTKVAVWSAVGGILLVSVGGQWFPGYQLDSTAIKTSKELAADAVGAVMAELCAERFMQASGLEARLAGLNGETGEWSKANYIRKGEWAEAPGGGSSSHDTAQRCVVLIAERLSKQPEKTS